MNYILTSDFFITDFVGGAALNDEEIYKVFKENKENITKIKTSDITEEFLEEQKDSFFIVSNFFHLKEDLKQKLSELKYAIYAHDYKFVEHTNPAVYEDFLVPKDKLINKDFFEKSLGIFCQSTFQQGIYNKNLDVLRLTLNVSGNLWPKESFELMEEYSKKEKKNTCSVIKSRFPQKGVPESIKFCIEKTFDYELIWDEEYHSFLRKLGSNAGLSFIPFTPETLCRAVVEAKMMNVNVFTTNMVGASYEKWFEKNGTELIEYMKGRKDYVYKRIKLIGSK